MAVVTCPYTLRLACAAVLCALAPLALGQGSFPVRPLRCVVPLAVGGGTDIIARLFATKAAESLGQQIVIDNRPGAGGVIGADVGAKAAPDGYTVVMVSSSHTVLPAMHRKLPYDTVRDFSPVTMVARYPLLIAVHPSVAARNVKELIALAKAKPGQLTYASSGSGSAAHLSAELFKTMAGIDLVHVPYTGSGPAMVALIGGQTSIGFYSESGIGAQVKAGKLRALAATSRERAPTLPDVPTVHETGLTGYEYITWAGLLVPAGTPRPVIDRLQRAYARALDSADIRDKLAAMGFEPVGGTPEAFAEIIRSEVPKWAKVVRDAGARVD